MPLDTLRFGGNCPHCILEIPGDEAPTDPGLVVRQSKEQEEQVRATWEVWFTIAKDGTTKGVRIKAVNAKDAELEGCLERSVKSWKFQKIYEEKPVTKPFRFGGASL